jgi:hypothetical protein
VFRRREIAAVLLGDVADTWDIGAIEVELAIAVAVVPLPRSADIRWFVARFPATSRSPRRVREDRVAHSLRPAG